MYIAYILYFSFFIKLRYHLTPVRMAKIKKPTELNRKFYSGLKDDLTT